MPAKITTLGNKRLKKVDTPRSRSVHTNGNGHSNGNGLLNAMGVLAKNPTQIRVLPTPLTDGTKLEGVSEKVFLDRYSLKDEVGNAIEEYPEQMWRRVARAIAQVEETEAKRTEWEKKFYGAMEGFKFVPGGRILSGAGTGFDVTYYNCLPPDQEVLTPDGYVSISKIKVGDKVITGEGRARPVRRVFKRKTKEALFVIKPKKLGFDNLRLTGEHPVLGIRSGWVNAHRGRDGLRLKNEPGWIKAQELKEGDFVAVGFPLESKELVESKLYLKDWLPDDFSVQSDGYLNKVKLHKKVLNEIDIDEDFMLLAGTWLGDGCVTHRTGSSIPAGIQITFNNEQKEWAQEVAGIITEKFEVIPTVREDKWGQNLIQLRVESYPVGLFFKNVFGAYSYKKRIPRVLFEQPNKFTLPLLKGLLRSDGYLTDKVMGVALSNKILAVQLHQLLLRTGRFFSIYENTHKGGRHSAYRVNGGVSQANGLCEYVFGQKRKNIHHDQDYFLKHDGRYWVRVDSVQSENYEGVVYDLEVEEDHSFISAGVVVSNCYVLPSPKDSRRGIMENITDMVDIMARGGGVGVNLSSLRPKGSRVRKVNGFSSGPMVWAELYSVATHDVIQQGGTRRGALMLMLWDWHPDIEEFITIKKDLRKIVGANLSVCVSDRLMQAVKEDEDWPLLFPDIDDPLYDQKWDGILDNWLKDGGKVKIYKTIKARFLWDLICEAAWASAEPGLHFMERTNKLSSNWYFNYLNCTNPCGEEALPSWGVCNLGSLNLANFVSDQGEMDYPSLYEHARVATRFLDNIVNGDIYMFEGIRETQLNGERRIGLGTMGLGDALIKIKIRYGSDESIPVIEKIYQTIRDAAFDTSADLSVEKGPFPKFDRQKYSQGLFIKTLPTQIQRKIAKSGIRNSVLLMQAPTGSTSLLAGVTSGIEPVYEFSFIRRDRIGEHRIYHPLLEAWRAEHPSELIPDYFVASSDLRPEEHVRVQAAVQKYVDASISKTVNASNSYTVEDVKKLYGLAYELGLKGITFFRDGSRPGVLSKEEPQVPKEEKKIDQADKTVGQMILDTSVDPTGLVRTRPESAEGVTYKMATPLGTAFITINWDEGGDPLEVFINIGKAGSDVNAMAEAFGRLLSTMLRLKGSTHPLERVNEIVEQLSGIGGRSSVGFGQNKVRSLPDAIAVTLAKHYKLNGYKNGGSQPSESTGSGPSNLQAEAVMAAHNPDPTPASADLNPASAPRAADICPKCGVASFVREEGCSKCYSCGHAEC